MTPAEPDRDETLATYEAHAEEYIARTGTTPSPLVAALSATLPPGSTVLELGSGPGTDAEALERAGFKVDRTDAATAFVDRLLAAGHRARRLDALKDDFGGPYTAVFAAAVFLHFTPPELTQVLRRAWRSVEPNGLLAMTVKEGDGDEWSTSKLDAPRYFKYWRRPELRHTLRGAGWAELRTLSNTDGHGQPWLTVIARRNPDSGRSR